MITLTQILGTLVVVGALAMGVHEVWVHRNPERLGFSASPRRLRRRLTGVVFILALVALLTWAGHSSDPRLKLTLYGLSMILVVLLLGLAMADARDTGRQIVRENLALDPDTARALAHNPRVRELVQRLGGGELGEAGLAELERELRDQSEESKD